jgi:ketosteroid isomerase-like protein
MKKIVPIILMSISLVSTGISQVAANEVEDVRAAVNELYTAINARDTDTFLKYMGPDGYTEYSYDGSPLLTVGEDRVRRNFATEFKSNFEVQGLKVKIFKNAAVVTGYRIGTLVRSDGTGHHINKLSLSMMWFYQEDGWELVHVHLSIPKS